MVFEYYRSTDLSARSGSDRSDAQLSQDEQPRVIITDLFTRDREMDYVVKFESLSQMLNRCDTSRPSSSNHEELWQTEARRVNQLLPVSCTCRFPTYMGLPCRHVFASLAHRKVFLNVAKWGSLQLFPFFSLMILPRWRVRLSSAAFQFASSSSSSSTSPALPVEQSVMTRLKNYDAALRQGEFSQWVICL
jgi:hypothetical protein